MNDADIEAAALADTGNMLHKATTTGTPVFDTDERFYELLSAARTAYLTGESMTAAIAEAAVNAKVRITDGQLWTLTQEAQR
jgi:hypothetical protein